MRTETGKEHIRSSGLAETLFSDYRRRVLALMLLRPDEHFHVREISRLTEANDLLQDVEAWIKSHRPELM